jgi:hypothetical protein
MSYIVKVDRIYRNHWSYTDLIKSRPKVFLDGDGNIFGSYYV